MSTTTTTTTTGDGVTTTVTTTISAPPETAAAPTPAEEASEVLRPPVPPGPTLLNDWIALCTEKPIEVPGLGPIFDPHQHFFKFDEASAGDNIIPNPAPAIAGFSGNPAMESTFGVRNSVFQPRHSHADPAKFDAGEDVKVVVYMPEHLLADMAGNNIEGTLYQQAFHMLDMAAFAEGGNPLMAPLGEVRAIAKYREQHKGKMCQVMNAEAHLSVGAAIEPYLAELAKFDFVCGVRQAMAALEGDKPGLPSSIPELFVVPIGTDWNGYDDPKFREGFALLDKYNLTFDAWLYHKQIPCLTRLAKAFPKTQICLNHIGTPVIVNQGNAFATKSKNTQSYEEVFAEWKVNISALAECPNVVVKVGGLPMPMSGFDWSQRPVPPTAAEVAQRLAPWYMFVIEKFGADRCMFESNFPMDRTSMSYTCLWNAYKIMTEGLPLADRKKLFRETAKKFYRV